MGLLDSIFSGSQGGYGGGGYPSLLDSLLYPSPLNRQEAAPQPQYDPMGNYTGLTPQSANSPFPDLPAANYAQFAPKADSPAYSPFNQGAAGLPGMMPSPQPQAPVLPPPQTVAPAPQPSAASQNGPTGSVMVGDNYRMPQFGSPTGQAQPSSTDISAQSRQPQPDQSPGLPPAFGGGGYLNRIANGGSLIGSLFGDSGQQQNLSAQYHAIRQALETNGDSKQVAASKAMVAVMNPEAARTILPELFTNKTELKMVTDQFGGQHPYSWNSREQTFKPVGVNGETSGESAAVGGPGYLNKGVAEYNPALPGKEYLSQFAPDVQSAILAYKRGDSMPTGNARKGWAENVQKFAKAYGDKIGEPVNDQTFFEKKKLKTELGASGNSSIGGILDNGESSFMHLAELGKSFSKLGNASHDYPLGGYVAYGQNAIGNAMGGSDTKAKLGAATNNLLRYGQESTKFYAGTGGGEAERLAAGKLVPPQTSSGEEQAAYLEKEKSLMLDRLQAKFDHIRRTLGDDEANKEIAKHMPSLNKNIQEIDSSISALRGGASASTGSSSGNTTKSGVSWSIVK